MADGFRAYAGEPSGSTALVQDAAAGNTTLYSESITQKSEAMATEIPILPSDDSPGQMPAADEEPSPADPETKADVEPSPADPKTETDAVPSPADPKTETDAVPSPADPETETDAVPSFADPETEADAVPSFADPETEADAEPSSADPKAETDTESSPAGSETTPMAIEESCIPTPDEAPMFDAAIEYYSHGYYIVKGSFTEFLPDTVLVRPLYSLDGENWQACGRDWDLSGFNAEEEAGLTHLYNQICLYNSDEPFKSYLAGELDSFYLKLQITRENGESYETQSAVIERGAPQPVSEEFSLIAAFTSSMRVYEMSSRSVYGRYQITINENTSPEEAAAFLPDTIPIQIGLYHGIDFVADGIIDCPVTWKPLSFSGLTAGESITIQDAAEEIIIPADTLFRTPMGVFQLDEPLGLNHDTMTDEIRLVLNVVSEKENPTGALTAENNGLELTFDFKPTGASSIRAYTLSIGDTEWTELPALSLLETINAQPSTANSSYALVITNDQEPYRSYLAAKAAGMEPSPFLIGLKIEGGVYDGRQLILSWPGSYDPPLQLPVMGGSGGNEGNAGADNKSDSTEEGQRPELPQQMEEKSQAESEDLHPETKTENTQAEPAQDPEEKTGASDQRQDPAGNVREPLTAPAQKSEENAMKLQTGRTQAPGSGAAEPTSSPAQTPETQKTNQPLDSQALNSLPDRSREQVSDEMIPSEPSSAAVQAAADPSDVSIQENSGSQKTGGTPLLPAAASAAVICAAAAFHKAAALRKIRSVLHGLFLTK